jgi:DNA-directed RNA polymerase subunit L
MSFDIKIKELDNIKYHITKHKLGKDIEYKVPHSSKLTLEFEGKDINAIFINTLRRIIYDYIPSYAFHSDFMNFTTNTSVFNNDMLRTRFEHIPVLDIDSDIVYLEEKYWKNVDYSDRPIHPKEKIIEMHIDVENNTNQIYNVTTNDIKYYEESKQIHNKYSQECPILLVQLKPEQKIKCSLKAILGLGLTNAIWNAGHSYYDEISSSDEKDNKSGKNKIIFTVESSGQYTEYDILKKACDLVIRKLNDAEKIITDVVDKVEKDIITKIQFIDEDHTLCQLLSDAFQDHPNIKFCGVTKPDNLVRTMIFKIVSSNTDLKKSLLEQIDMLKKKFKYIKDKIILLSK